MKGTFFFFFFKSSHCCSSWCLWSQDWAVSLFPVAPRFPFSSGYNQNSEKTVFRVTWNGEQKQGAVSINICLVQWALWKSNSLPPIVPLRNKHESSYSTAFLFTQPKQSEICFFGKTFLTLYLATETMHWQLFGGGLQARPHPRKYRVQEHSLYLPLQARCQSTSFTDGHRYDTPSHRAC